MSGLGDALEKLRDAVGDLASLEVNTYVGKLTTEVQTSDGLSLIDFEKLVSEARGGSGSVSLVASTKIHFDGDANQFFSSDPVPDHVIEAHRVALDSGREVREGIIKLFGNLLDIDVTPGT